LRPLRIVQFVETLEVGGLERLAVDLALAQRAAGQQAAVYCLFGAGPLAAELEKADIPVVTFHKDRHSKAGVVWQMTRRMRGDRPDIIHVHNPGAHHFAATAKRIAGVPVCLNTRHSEFLTNGEPYQERYFRWVEPFTEHVVFVCEDVRRALMPRIGYPGEKCSVILNGIPIEKFATRQASPGRARPRLRLGTIGRLVRAKGHAVLIEAFARIADRLPEASLHIYGYGPLEDELRALIARLEMEKRIALEGRTDDAARTLAGLDIFVFPSLNEGLPLAIMEAMAAGLPVVSTRVGGVPEVAPERLFPWHCEPGSVEGLADAMLRAADCAALAEIGAAARRVALENYGFTKMCAQYEALYRKLLGK
jgi:glycosyltransferase involved in cell wall biosynthesis